MRDWFSDMGVIKNNSDRIENYEECLKRSTWMIQHYDDFIDKLIISWPDLMSFIISHSELGERDPSYPYANEVNKFLDKLEVNKDKIKLPEIQCDDPGVKKIIDAFDGELIHYTDADAEIRFDNYREPIVVIDDAIERYTDEMSRKSDELRNSEILTL